MKRTTLAVAMALCLASISFGAGSALSTPTVDESGQQSICERVDYVIPELIPMPRVLVADDELELANSDEVGITVVTANIVKELQVQHLGGDGALEWSVFTEDAQGDCVQFNAQECSGTLLFVLEQDSCELAPSNLRPYFGFFELVDGDMVAYGASTAPVVE